MYKLNLKSSFEKSYEKIVRKNNQLIERIQKILKMLKADPSHPALKSHKVQTRLFGERWSSRVTGDIRIIWDFDEDNNLVILVLDIGGHSGSRKVYK